MSVILQQFQVSFENYLHHLNSAKLEKLDKIHIT